QLCCPLDKPGLSRQLCRGSAEISAICARSVRGVWWVGFVHRPVGPDAGGAAPGPCTERAVLPMRSERSGCWVEDGEVAGGAIALQVLREDHEERWSRAQLEREIYDIEPLVLGDALCRLREQGVVLVAGELVWASRCARHLDHLGMISI